MNHSLIREKKGVKWKLEKIEGPFVRELRIYPNLSENDLFVIVVWGKKE